jgi:hypothetical protein
MPDLYDYARAVRAFMESYAVGRGYTEPGLWDHMGYLTAQVLDGAPEPDAVVPAHELGGEGGGA